MAIIPDIQTLNANSVDVVNAIRNEASDAYRAAVPVAQATTESLRTVGNAIMNFQATQNEFLNLLVNRIGRVILTSKLYDNPWAFFKKGLLEYGETVEEIFTVIAQPHLYDVQLSETNQFKREIPDVRAAFHYLNYQTFYKTTIQSRQLKQAFLSWDGVTSLISSIIDSLYTGANYDEFVMMKYMIAKAALAGQLYPVNIPAVTKDNASEIVADIKGISNQLEFMSSEYNLAHVPTFTSKSDQYIILNATFDATIDVMVLASAFNMDKAEFMGRRVLVDSFAVQDTERLNKLLANDLNYQPFTTQELAKLASIPAVILDKDWFMIFDNMLEFTDKFNGEGLYWNYWLHVWKTFSSSPYSNGILFTTAGTTITALTITPSEVTSYKGGSVQFVALSDSAGFASNNVTWECSGSDSTIENGILKVGRNETENSITVTATSTVNTSITAMATVMIL